jgi:hypothetical protein
MSITLHAQVLALLEVGIPIVQITQYTGLVKSTIYRIRKITTERGYNSSISHEFRDEYFVDARHTG